MIVRLATLAIAAVLLTVGLQQPSSEAARDRLERAYRANNLGVAYLEQYDYDAAAKAFREALQIDSGLSLAHLNLAIALLYGNHADAALPEARAAAAALPDRAQPPYVLGLIARADNRTDDAIAAFRRVLEIDPADAATKVNLGQVLLQQRQFDEAVRLFREAVAAEPYNATAAYNLATGLTRSGDADGGQQAMKRFQTLRDSAYAVTYAQGYLQQGRYAEALASTGAEPDLVDTRTPAVTFADATSQAFGAAARPAPGAATGASGGSVLLFDLDNDGDLDLFTIGPDGQHLFRNDGGRFIDITAAAHLETSATGIAAVAGDYDNDGRPDLFILRDGAGVVMHQGADGAFEDVTSATGIVAQGLRGGTAAWVDVDHDGDLDLLAGSPLHLFRNNGNGTFTDITSDAGLATKLQALAIVPTDYDNHRDVDLLIAPDRAAPVLYRNMRDGTFRDAAAAAGLPQDQTVTAVAVGDVNKDGFTDFFFGRAGAPGVFALSDGREHFVRREGPDGSNDASAAQFFDYDNDGLLDLLVVTSHGTRLFRNLGDRWSDETTNAKLETLGSTAVRSLALGDIDGDGDTDAIARLADGRLQVWRNDGGSRHTSLRVALAARVSNRSAAGTKVEIRAGSLRQLLERSLTTPAVAPADLVFGLGSRPASDIVRVLWPSGILQSEMTTTTKGEIKIEELDRKPSSCPYLFTWNGSRFEFVTDFMGGGEMGDWVGPAIWNTPDPDEYVRIRGDQLRERDGRYELRITNELEEAMFLDRVQLLAVDHPADADVYPNEGLKEPPRPAFKLYATRGAHPPAQAVDEHGHDVRFLIAERDRQWPDDFAMSAIRGYAASHSLTLGLGPDADEAVLLMTGWTDYAFSTDNVAAAQSGLAMLPPVLQVRDRQGEWRTVMDNVGFPVGRPQTVVIDLRGKWLGPSRDVRILTNMRIYWDQVLLDTSGGQLPFTIARLDPATAQLRWRGFSAEESPDGREPFGANYARVSTSSPWKALPGRYTREGDVRALLNRTDDMFVIAGPGDEIVLSFDAAQAPPLRSGWRRTFLLYADGFSKEMNIRSATPDTLGPLPFHAMTGYPYGAQEHYPEARAYREYQERYNTRVVSRPLPTIDAALAR
jgi:tetratricopeptide (TPR) repeat protein